MTQTSISALDFPRQKAAAAGRYVPESRFGVWFLGTGTWETHVLMRAIEDLDGLIENRRASYPVIVDIGCGFGRAFKLLSNRFRPTRIVGIELDSRMLASASAEAKRSGLAVEIKRASASSLPLADQSTDMVFCHQTFHHLVDQHNALAEFHRVLRPGGLLLFAESTRKYIHSWIIRTLFRHPMDVQRSAPEYLAMISKAGFAIHPSSVSYPYLWWSRGDFAIMERCFGVAPPAVREETLVNVVAVRE
ncbi:MAG: class I SAM-dependent methyltransferase [Candidatus Binataceae bacterium]